MCESYRDRGETLDVVGYEPNVTVSFLLMDFYRWIMYIHIN